jgi:undecaprenyl-diphosphatase
LAPLDEYLFRTVYAAGSGSLTWLATAFTVLGNGWVILLVLPFLLSRRHRPNALALVSVLVLVAGLKLVVHRARPCNGLSGVRCLWGEAPTDYSFPSGHAAGSFAFVAFVLGVVLFSEKPKVAYKHGPLAVVLLASAMCIALSRVYLGVHFPGDVAAGALLGATVGLLGARLHLKRERPKADDAPSLPASRRQPETRT